MIWQAGVILFIATISAWIVARAIKLALDFNNEKKFSWDMLFRDGGMPSGHTAITAGLATSLYVQSGTSYYFVISLVLLFIVVNDAVKVRWLTGEQSKIINKLTKGMKGFPHLEERAGHTLMEVIVGGIIGVAVPLIFYAIL